ncbi:cation-translocating P-type ATPase [Shewanella polaris]|uniref:Cation-translocating P-type ATPase n=1 Tax=Shewanella polaris TaxID=2588449 RepID=A0A4Y5YFX5_9GAMM|nr:cation-translocating P-type ATPase [Shewanella polaris]QDE31527.1 cation-translocating P-type ATPase [Shewanella polaris]
MSSPKWHSLQSADVLQRLDSSLTGLTIEQAKKRLIEYGHNAIIQKKRRSLLFILLGQFSDFMIIVLLVAAVISGFLGELQDTIAILVIVLLNAIIGTGQEYRAERAVAALRKMAAPDAHVLRDTNEVTIDTIELVPGDIVMLEAGNIVPADLRLLEEEDLQVDESALTGESSAIEKQTEPLVNTELAIGDRLNLVFKSSMITRGRGKGVVVASGMETEIGQIAGLLQDETNVKTPLQTRLSRFGRYLALAVLAICIMVFVVGLLQGQPILLMFLTSVSLGVAAIPEALPAVVTISLALGARKLIRHNALVRNLPAVETLGSVTYICTDKTGTLTQNLMTAELFYAAGELRKAMPESEASIPWTELGQAMALNNDIMVKDGKPAGEPTELALFEAAHMAGFDKSILEQAKPRIAVIAFDSQRKQMTTLHQTSDVVTAYIKGAPEKVLQQCIQGLNNDGATAFEVATVLAEATQLASKGYRVLAFAKREFNRLPDPLEADVVERELTFLGLVALIDPPRPEVPKAVNDCLTASIIPVMITGDHPGTAFAIAQRLGIIDDDSAMLSGDQLAKIPDEEFSRLVDTIRVYARVTPEQKLRIVKALQEKGEFVAMTGDGVNDAPALKRASIGVAMGLKGTDVAREASDMVLLDDDFSSIVRAIRSGRRTFDNIRKFIKYTLSSNFGEILTLFLAPFFGLPIPLLPIHILWINLVTDGLPGLALTTEPAEPNIMNRAPTPPKESIFSHGMWQHIIWVGLFIGGISIATMAWAISRDLVYWQTMVFTVLTVSQLFHALAVRSNSTSLLRTGLFSNLPMLGAFLLTLLLQMVVIYTPVLNTIFHTQPLPMADLAVCMFISSLILFAVEIEKWLIRRGVIYA